MTLFEKIGGQAVVDKAVVLFHAKMIADARLSGFFDLISQEDYYRKQGWFLTTVLKGETLGADSYMRMAHRKLVRKHGLKEEHFNAVTDHLRAALDELGIHCGAVDEIVDAAASLKEAVLDR